MDLSHSGLFLPISWINDVIKSLSLFVDLSSLAYLCKWKKILDVVSSSLLELQSISSRLISVSSISFDSSSSFRSSSFSFIFFFFGLQNKEVALLFAL